MNHTAKVKNKRLPHLYFIALSLVFALLVYQGKALSEAAYDSLVFAATKLIPSMFLFAVLAKLAAFVSLSSSTRDVPLLRLPLGALPALVIGLFSGFPMGAYAAKELLDHGTLSEKKAIHLASFANNASLAFLLFTVAPLFGDTAVGWLLFASSTAASLVVGILFSPKEKEPTLTLDELSIPPFFTLFCNATVSATQAMLTLTGYLVLFGVAAKALLMTSLPAPLITLCLLLLEPTAAMRHLATLPHALAIPLAAFSLGFSGLSILMQSMTVWQNRLPLARLAAIRFLIGILSALFSLFFLKIL